MSQQARACGQSRRSGWRAQSNLQSALRSVASQAKGRQSLSPPSTARARSPAAGPQFAAHPKLALTCRSPTLPSSQFSLLSNFGNSLFAWSNLW